MNEPASFEEALELLEDSVARLEAGDLKLEEALQVFEQGVVASRACTRWLDQTRKRVQVLTADAEGEFRLSFLDEADSGPDEEA
jgi:exodeoxyribonuclease VII small subunit